MNPQVDEHIRNLKKWQEEIEMLRATVLDCLLTEEYKWRQPCYTFQNKIILIISGFKEYCALNFFKGGLLQDEKKIMVKPGENTQAGRQIRFTNTKEIIKLEPVLKAYIYEAIEVEKAGVEVNHKKPSEYAMPEEFQKKLDESPILKTAFETLTPGRQKAYLIHFSEPKQSKTRESRIEKYIDRILNGKGLTDCICGLSRRKPTCDGSHKNI